MESALLGVVLDSSTAITAERRNLPVPQLIEAIQTAHGEIEISLSPVTVAELVHGIYRAKTPEASQRRRAYVEELADLVPIHPVTKQTAFLVGRIQGQEAAKGNVLPLNDLMIAAAAIEQGYAILTGNLRHFQKVPGLIVLTLYEGASDYQGGCGGSYFDFEDDFDSLPGIPGGACTSSGPGSSKQAPPAQPWYTDVGYRPVLTAGGASFDHLFIWVHLAGVTPGTANASNSEVFDGGPSGPCPLSCGNLEALSSPTGVYSEVHNPNMVDFLSAAAGFFGLLSLNRDADSLSSSLTSGVQYAYNAILGPNSNSVAYTLLADLRLSVPSITMTSLFGISVGTLNFDGVTQYFTGWGQYLMSNQ
jgi:predicted nucleic acid-binding protein